MTFYVGGVVQGAGSLTSLVVAKGASSLVGAQPAIAPGAVGVLRFSGAVEVQVGGIVGGVDGRILIVRAGGAGDVRLVHEDGTATDVNRFWSPAAADYVIGAGYCAALWYDALAPGGGGAAGRWVRWTYM